MADIFVGEMDVCAAQSASYVPSQQRTMVDAKCASNVCASK